MKHAGVRFVLGVSARGRRPNPDADGYLGDPGLEALATYALGLFDVEVPDGAAVATDDENERAVVALGISVKCMQDDLGNRVAIGFVLGHDATKSAKRMERRMLRALRGGTDEPPATKPAPSLPPAIAGALSDVLG